MYGTPSNRPDFEGIEDIMADALALGRGAARRLQAVDLRGTRIADTAWLARKLAGAGLIEANVLDALEDVVRVLREREDASWTLVQGDDGNSSVSEIGLTPAGARAADARGALEEVIRLARRVDDLLTAESIVAHRRDLEMLARYKRKTEHRP